MRPYTFQHWTLSSVSSHKDRGSRPPQQNIRSAAQHHNQNSQLLSRIKPALLILAARVHVVNLKSPAVERAAAAGGLILAFLHVHEQVRDYKYEPGPAMKVQFKPARRG